MIKTIFPILLLTLINCGQSIPAFDGDKAYDYLVKQCEFGSRVPNSEAHKKCCDYLYETLKENGEIARKQEFIYYDDFRKDTLHLTNIIASFNASQTNRTLLCAHWDCRPWADRDTDSSLHDQPVLGANDGASGVAVLLTIAEILHDNPPTIGVDIIFFDGEDYGDYDINDKWLLGSKYFTAHIGNYRPRQVILLDMIGDADLNIHKDMNSFTYANWLVNRVWNAAKLENAEHFFPDIKHSVYDDHVPFLELGIPAVDIIDMDYEWWHTTKDIPENCSRASLDEVGRVIMRLLYDKQFQ